MLCATYGTLLLLYRTKIFVDQQTFISYSLKKPTVQELLKIYQIKISPQDIVKPSLDAQLRWGQNVQVIRVTEIVSEKKNDIPFILDWKRRTSKNLRLIEIQKGHQIVQTWKERTIFHDAKSVTTLKFDQKTKKIVTERIILMDAKGYAEKIYDLSKIKKKVVVATAYWKGDPQVPGVITFSGHPVERGLVAVDPTTIPLGYRLYIPDYGYAYSSDTGSAIKGNRIDLFVENKKASRPWEYRKVNVYILEKEKKW